MIKCPYCGNQLSIEDEVCPFCGKKNEAAKEYTQTMGHYKYEWKKARGQIDDTTRFVKNFVVFLVIAIILAVANIAVLILQKNSYELESYLKERDIDRNYSAYCKQVEDYINEGDYYKFYCFYNEKDLYYSNRMMQYEELHRLSRYYYQIFNDIRYLVGVEGIEYYSTKDELLDDLSARIKAFYNQYDGTDNKYIKEYTTEWGNSKIEEMKDKVDHMLAYYLKLQPEQIASCSTLSKAQIGVAIGRSLGIYE